MKHSQIVQTSLGTRLRLPIVVPIVGGIIGAQLFRGVGF